MPFSNLELLRRVNIIEVTSWWHTFLKLLGMLFIEGSLEVKLPTIWTDEKQSREEAERRERLEERRVEEKRVRKKKMQMREKVGSRETLCFSNDLGLRRCRKVGLAKAAGAEPAGQMRGEKIARRCGAKHIWKSKCTKH